MFAKIKSSVRSLCTLAVLASAAGLLAGCPTDSQGLYDVGFAAGFAVDDEYWQGYIDSYDTRDGGPIYYTGSEIPYYNDLSYDAGYYDGIWYAYNDGYFVEYDYAFTIGFSEGYDAAFHSDWFQFIASDQHVEWLDGGFSDGYNDGFSEGRILGAYDYKTGLPFDWLDAMSFYREPNDVYLDELGLGTGEYGPVYLYEYGTDPADLIAKGKSTPRAIRGAAKQDAHAISYRPIPDDVKTLLNTAPATAARGGRTLSLTSTWYDRVKAYNDLYDKSGGRPRPRLSLAP